MAEKNKSSGCFGCLGIIILGVLGMAYLAAPYFAGVMELGKRSGPVWWPEWLHETLYIIGCEGANGYKPRRAPEDIFLRRPFFYGLPERPYPKAKRLRMIEEREKRNPENDFSSMKEAEERVSEKEANGQYSMFDPRRKIFIGEAKHKNTTTLSNARESADKFEILAEVVSAAPFLIEMPEGGMQLKNWAVVLRVKNIVHGTPDATHGETITIHVHSPVQTFGVAVDEIAGKTFLVRYDDVFAKDYWGEVEIDFESGGWGSGLPENEK